MTTVCVVAGFLDMLVELRTFPGSFLSQLALDFRLEVGAFSVDLVDVDQVCFAIDYLQELERNFELAA